MLHTVLHFKTEEHLKRFGADEELTKLRAGAGAIVETGTFTPITDEAFINYPNILNQDQQIKLAFKILNFYTAVHYARGVRNLVQ